MLLEYYLMTPILNKNDSNFYTKIAVIFFIMKAQNVVIQIG